MTAAVGSYPKPKYLFPKSGRELLDTCGMNFFDLRERIGEKEFNKRLNKASLMAIRDQNGAGIDFTSDGEERRDHYVVYILRRLGGFDFKNLRKKKMRQGIYERYVPSVVAKISFGGPIIINDYIFTKKHTKGIAKIGFPGPATVVDCVVDHHYNRDTEQLAMDYAKAVRSEVKNLIDAGCRAIQFDDPVLLRYPDEAKKWGLRALQACFQGFEEDALYIVHICRGYPHKQLEEKGISYKANERYYSYVLNWLSKTAIDVISIEGAHENLDLSILTEAGKKTVMLGVIDVGSNEVESVDSIVKRGEEALQFIPYNQLILAPDCGMIELTREAARKKLRNIAKAASILNKYIT